MKQGFNKQDYARNAFMLTGGQAKQGYDWWWHSFTGYEKETGEEKSFFIEFFLCNPARAEREPVLGQKPENKRQGKKPSYCMVKVGAWGEDAVQLHRFFSWSQVSYTKGTPFFIEAEDCYLDENKTWGHVKCEAETIKQHPEYLCDAGEMSWNLEIRKDIAFQVGYGAGRLFRSLQLFEMFWHVQGMKTYYQGEVVFAGKTYLVKPEKCFGYADKNWGKDFTSPWVWLSSNDLVSKNGKRLENSVFDIGGGCPKVGPIALKRKLLSAFWYEGTPYEFNFSKFWTFTRTKFACRETKEDIIWHVEQKNWTQRMVTDISCKKKDMLLVNYEAPNGRKRHNRLWNGGNGVGTVKLYHKGKLVDEITCSHVGCEYGEYTE